MQLQLKNRSTHNDLVWELCRALYIETTEIENIVTSNVIKKENERK